MKPFIMKTLLPCFCVWLACAPLQASHVQAAAQSRPAVEGPIVVTAAASASEAAAPEEQVSLAAFLPDTLPALAETLVQMAAGQGIRLEVRAQAPGQRYREQLAEALQSETPPAVYWLEGETDLQYLLQNGTVPNGLADAILPLALRQLAQTAPAAWQLQNTEGAVCGIPVGLYGTGYLVNLPCLAALLGAKSQTALLQDLTTCSYEEWQALVEALTSYLAKPRRMQLHLGAHTYVTPRYRPEAAQAVRGVFALPTAGGDLLDLHLQMAYSAAFQTPQALAQAGAEKRAAAIGAPLAAMLEVLALETRNMAGENGALSRGGTLAETAALERDAAEDMLARGAALFLLGTSKEILQLRLQNRQANGSIMLMPFKMPLEGEAAAMRNTRLGAAAEGYLCIGGNEAESAKAANLLVQLYTSAQGNQTLGGTLGLASIGAPCPQSALEAQVAHAAAAGGAYPLVTEPSALARGAAESSDWLRQNLLVKENWEEADTGAFIESYRNMAGLPAPA